MELIANLRQLIEAYGNKSELCRTGGISWETLHRVVSSRSNPRLKTLVKLLEALNCELKITNKS